MTTLDDAGILLFSTAPQNIAASFPLVGLAGEEHGGARATAFQHHSRHGKRAGAGKGAARRPRGSRRAADASSATPPKRSSKKKRDVGDAAEERCGGFTVAANYYSTTSSVGSDEKFTQPPPSSYAHRDRRLHQDFKALTKAERQRVVQREAADSDLLARTVHLRFLPTGMKQGELAALCRECGPFLRVRICGNASDNQNWIYGFVEFETKEGAAKLMQMNGRELRNGEGKPLLRLKCHTANQPIVDRVFHDADPATNNPCIFGQGSFEHRTLKDALDSYFNLKAKEQRQQQLQENGDPLTGFGSQGSAEGEGDTSSSSTRSHSDAAGGKGGAGKSQLRATAAAFMPPSNTTTPSGSVAPPPFYPASPEEMAAAVANNNFSVSNPSTPPLHPLPPPSYPVSIHLSPPLLPDAATLPPPPLPQLPSSFGAFGLGTVPSIDECDEGNAMLSLALKTMTSHSLAVNGEDVVQLGSVLLQRAFQQGNTYMTSRQQFFDTVGTLQHLLEKLDTHEALTGRAADTGNQDYTSELPQKVTQLRLVSLLMLILLHVAKRSIRDALPYTDALIRCVMEVPQMPLVPPPQFCIFPDPEGLLRPFSQDECRSQEPLFLSSPKEPESSGSPLIAPEARLLQSILAGEDDDEEEGDTEAGPESIPARIPAASALDNDKVSRLLAASMFSHTASFTDPKSSTADAERVGLYWRDVQFHRYVLNVLLCAGIAVEEVMPDMASQMYASALTRAQKVLGLANEGAVRRCCSYKSAAAGNSEHDDQRVGAPRLGDVVLNVGGSESASSRHDVTAFPRLFFQSAAAVMPPQGEEGSAPQDSSQLWATLPPMHLLNFFQMDASQWMR